MGEPFYSVDGSVVRSDFFGFSLTLPSGWCVAGARASGGKASLWFGPPTGGTDQLTITIHPRDEEKIARYFADPTLAPMPFSGRAAFPFGEAMVANVRRAQLLFRQNDVIVLIDEREGQPDIEAGMDAMLNSLTFFAPSADAVPKELKAFTYLHPGARAKKPTGRSPLTDAELEARIAFHRERGHLYDAGLTAATLERASDARALLGLAAQQLQRIASEKQPPEVAVFADALESAMFSRDGDVVAALARSSPARAQPGDAWADRATFVRALALLATGDDDEARAELDATPDVAPKRAWMPVAIALLRAIVERDEDAYRAAMKDVLGAHHRKARAKTSMIRNSARSFVCTPATAAAIVATQRGLTVPDVSERRATLTGLIAYAATSTSEGPILPGATFDLDVDYVPAALTTN